jgi:hypothetical protein
VKVLRGPRPDLSSVQPHAVGADPEVTLRAAALIEAFVQECRQRGIAVYLTAPAFPRPRGESQVRIVQEIESLLCRNVTAPLLVTARETALPLDRFYDTPYHLTSRGAAERSELLGRRLAQALGRPREMPGTGPLTPSERRDPLLSIPAQK